jgi:hypothetical protein
MMSAFEIVGLIMVVILGIPAVYAFVGIVIMAYRALIEDLTYFIRKLRKG